MIRRSFGAMLAAALLLAAGSAAQAGDVPLTAAWTQIGAVGASVSVQAKSNQPVLIQQSAAAPTADTGDVLVAGGTTDREVLQNLPANLWAKALGTGSGLVSVQASGAVSGGGGGGGGGGGAAYGPDSVGAAPTHPPLFMGYTDGSGNIKAITPSAGLPTADALADTALGSPGDTMASVGGNGSAIAQLKQAVTQLAAVVTKLSGTGAVNLYNGGSANGSGNPFYAAVTNPTATGSVSAAGTSGSQAQAVQGIVGGVPQPTNLTQLGSTTLGAPTAYGTAPTGNVAGVNAYVTNQSNETAGSALAGPGVRVMGSDGTNARDVATTTAGALMPPTCVSGKCTAWFAALTAGQSGTLLAANANRVGYTIQCTGTAAVTVSEIGSTLTSVTPSAGAGVTLIIPASAAGPYFSPLVPSLTLITAYSASAQSCWGMESNK